MKHVLLLLSAFAIASTVPAPAWAQTMMQGSSGYISYPDGSTARVSVVNSSPAEASPGVPNPPCPVRVTFYDAAGASLGVSNLEVDPSSGVIQDQVLPDSPGVPPGATRADVAFAKTALCSEKTIQIRLEFFDTTSGALAANKYEVSTRRGGKIN